MDGDSATVRDQHPANDREAETTAGSVHVSATKKLMEHFFPIGFEDTDSAILNGHEGKAAVAVRMDSALTLGEYLMALSMRLSRIWSR